MSRTLKTAIVGLISGIIGSAAEEPAADGRAAFERGDYVTAIRLLRPLAEQGNANAQFLLGVMYSTGRGVPKDYAAAINWYRKAADQGDPNAQTNLGVMYRDGHGYPQD